MTIKVLEYRSTVAEAELTADEARTALVESSWLSQEEAGALDEAGLAEELAQALVDDGDLSLVRYRLDRNTSTDAADRTVIAE